MAKTITIILGKEIVRSRAISNLIGVMSFIILTTLGSYVRIPLPFTPIPITLQTFFVILAGAVLGARLGSVSQAGYLALGVGGLPIFQNYSYGILHLAGPTGGYLLGFVIAPLVVGKLLSIRRNLTYSWVLFSMAAGSLIILLTGLTYLMGFLHIGFKEGFMLGVLYFLPGDFVKVTSAALIYLAFYRRFREVF